VNPRIGSGLKYGRRVEEEQTVEVVENHVGGTRMGIGVPISKEADGRVATRGSMLPGVGFLDRYDGGAIFGQPQERKPGFAAGSQGPESVGLLAPRSGGSREPLRKLWGADRSKVLEGRAAETQSKVEEGSSERPGSRDFDRSSSPRRWHLPMWRRGADHVPARATSAREGPLPRQQVP